MRMPWDKAFPEVVEKLSMPVVDPAIFSQIVKTSFNNWAVNNSMRGDPFSDIAKHFGAQIEQDYALDGYRILRNDGAKMMVSRYEIESDLDHFRKKIAEWLSQPTNSEAFTHEDRLRIYEMKRRAREYMSHMHVNGDILAGGCFVSMVHGEPVKDYDIFAYNQSSKMRLNEALLKDKTLRYTIRDGKYLNNGRIDQIIDDGQSKAQFIICDYPDREAVIDHFDVEHACVSYEYPKDILHISPLTWHCIKNKILKPHKGNRIQQWRQDKFIKKGFKLAAECV